MSYIPRSVDIVGLMRERKELVERISVIDGLLRFLRVDADSTPQEDSGEPQIPTLGLTEAARQILSEASGKPMHGTEILKRALAMGVRIGGQNPKNTLFGTLRRNQKDFRNVGSNNWVLAEREAGSSEIDLAQGEEKESTGTVSDYQKCMDAVEDMGRPVRVAEIEKRLEQSGTPVLKQSIWVYVRKGVKDGKLTKVDAGLYAAKEPAK